jgi:hypothetical protein
MSVVINGSTGISGVDGSAGTPALQGGDPDTGIFYGTNTVSIATNGVTAVTVDASGNTTFAAQTLLPDGSVSAPAISNTGDTNCGIYFPAADTVSVATSGTQAIQVNSSQQLEISDGTVSLPSLTNIGDTNTGVYFPAADNVAIATGGVAALTADSSQNVSVTNTLVMGSSFKRNRIINGNFSVAQRGTSFTSTDGANNDDTYNLDRWYILSDGNDAVDITQATDVPANGSKFSIGLDVETTNKKFGIAQIIENINCQGLIGNTVSLSFKAKVSSTAKLDNVKAAVVAWSSTADSVTSDIVSAWNVEGTDPTLASNLTYENTPANLNVTTGWATYNIENVSVDTASTTNIVVFIWSDVTDTTAGDFLYITDVQLEVGSVATPYERQIYSDQLSQCQRYYWRSNSTDAVFTSWGAGAVISATSVGSVNGKLPVTMRAKPTLNYSNARIWDGAGANPVTATVTNFSSVDSFGLDLTVGAGGLLAGRPGIFQSNNTTSAWFEAAAEL